MSGSFAARPCANDPEFNEAAHNAVLDESMELTQTLEGIMETADNAANVSMDLTQTMDMTRCVGGIVETADNAANVSMDLTQTMDMTRCVGGIVETADNAANVSMDLTQTMNMTRCVGGIVESADNAANVSMDLTQTMDMTRCVGGIVESADNAADSSMVGGMMGDVDTDLDNADVVMSDAHPVAIENADNVGEAAAPAATTADAASLAMPAYVCSGISDGCLHSVAHCERSWCSSETDIEAVPVDEFLSVAGIRFIDNMSTRRRTTMMGGRVLPTGSRADRMHIACVALPRLDLYENTCETLASTINGTASPLMRISKVTR
jgi:hypothetical protein